MAESEKKPCCGRAKPLDTKRLEEIREKYPEIPPHRLRSSRWANKVDEYIKDKEKKEKHGKS